MLFNKDTFFPHLLDKVREGESGWVVQGVLSRASFRRQPPSGQKSLTDKSLHINNSYAKKRSIGKKLILTSDAFDEKVDLVAGDFNGAAWRRDNSNSISIIEEAFADCRCLPAPHHCGDQGRFRVRGLTCVDSSNPRIQMENGKFLSTAHSHSPHEALGIRQTDQSCHHEVWLHLDFVERGSVQSHQEKHDRRRTITRKQSTQQVVMQATIRFPHRQGKHLPQMFRQGVFLTGKSEQRAAR